MRDRSSWLGTHAETNLLDGRTFCQRLCLEGLTVRCVETTKGAILREMAPLCFVGVGQHDRLPGGGLAHGGLHQPLTSKVRLIVDLTFASGSVPALWRQVLGAGELCPMAAARYLLRRSQRQRARWTLSMMQAPQPVVLRSTVTRRTEGATRLNRDHVLRRPSEALRPSPSVPA